jgi:hypothetical protein
MDGIDFLNTTMHLEPLVTIRLRDPSNNVFWNCSFNLTMRDVFIVEAPAEGNWTLRVEARAYGTEDLFGAEWHDRVRVVVETR